jgi:hypothetical protein
MSDTETVTTGKRRKALDEVLASKILQRSDQLRAILQYICEAAIEGREHPVTEYDIGVNVLHRREPFNPSEDSAVRTRVYDLRQRLSEYYQLENPAAPVRIEIPKGAYVPRFVEHAATLPVSPPVPRHFLIRRWPLLAAALVVLVFIPLAFFFFHRPDDEMTNDELKIWKPVLTAKGSVFICIGDSMMGEGDQRSRRLGVGSGLALYGLGNLFGRYNKPAQMRLGSLTDPSDVSRSSAVLIGDISNQPLVDVMSTLRYRLERDQDVATISDSKQPSSNWHASYDSQWNIVRDYGIVARLVPTDIHEAVMVIGGIQECGTGGSWYFLSGDGMSKLIKQLPPGWENKNFEAIVSIDAEHGICGIPQIVRTEVW